MAVTTLKIYGVNCGWFTTPIEENGQKMILVELWQLDNNFMKVGMEPLHTFLDVRTEEEFHKTFREKAVEKGELVSAFCSNPEWNPIDNFIEPMNYYE